MPLVESSYPHTFGALSGPTAPKPAFVIFYSDFVDGQMWCPDCRDVEDVVRKAFGGDDKPYGVVYWVGAREQWRDPKNAARAEWGVNSVPTIVRLEDGKETARLVEKDILDADKLKALLK